LQIRQGFEWIKANTPEDSVLLGQGIQVYAVYYAERSYIDAPMNETEYNLTDQSADYLIMHGFTPQHRITPYFQSRQDKWQPIQAFFFDQQQTQPATIIYKNIGK